MGKGKRMAPAIAVLVAGVAMAGCGVKEIGGNGEVIGPSNTQTACLKQAGMTLDPRDADLLELSRPKVKGTVSVYSFETDAAAKNLGDDVTGNGAGATIGRQVVVYNTTEAQSMKESVEGCLRRYSPPPLTHA